MAGRTGRRITILEVKTERIGDEVKRANVLRELMQLRRARNGSGLYLKTATKLEGQLRTLHGELWNAEDRLRGCERTGAFGPKFVKVARNVIRLNACQAEIARVVSTAHSSLRLEKKAYAAWHIQLHRTFVNPPVAINQMPGNTSVASK